MVKVRIVAAAMATALVSAGCGGVGGSSDGGGGGGGGGPVEITFSHWALTAPPFDKFVTGVIDEFNASQDDYVVKPQNIAYKTYHQDVFTQAGAGQGPTMIAIDSSELANAVEAGLALELTDKVELPDELSAYEESLGDDDGRYAVTMTRHPYSLLVNTKLLEESGAEVPTSFEEFQSIVKASTAPPDRFGFAFRHTTGDINGWWLDLSNWLYGAGGYWSDRSGKPTLDTPEVAEAITRMKTFLDEGYVPTGMDAPTYRRLFWEGKIPMLIESLAFASIFSAQSPELAANLEVHTLPFDRSEYLSSNNPVFVNASASDEEQEASLAFLNYMLTDEVQQQMVDTLGGSLVSADIPLEGKVVEENPWFATWEGENSGLDFTPPGVGSDFPQFRTAILDQMERILAGQVSVEEGLAQAQKDAEAALSR
jgi:multiple sugar transport system substrate-binding protein